MPLRTHPREVMVKPVGARPRQEVQKCQEDRSGEDDFAASHEAHKFFDKHAAVLAAETNFAARHKARKVFDKYLQYDYVKTVQATSGVPRFLKPVRLEERGAPANFVYEASRPLHKQLQFTCACTARTSTTAEDVERS